MNTSAATAPEKKKRNLQDILESKKPRRVIVNDLMQTGYEYVLSVQVGQCKGDGFWPELTPKQMLSLGVFGGKYMTDCAAEFPAEWFSGAKLCCERHDPALN